MGIFKEGDKLTLHPIHFDELIEYSINERYGDLLDIYNGKGGIYITGGVTYYIVKRGKGWGFSGATPNANAILKGLLEVLADSQEQCERLMRRELLHVSEAMPYATFNFSDFNSIASAFNSCVDKMHYDDKGHYSYITIPELMYVVTSPFDMMDEIKTSIDDMFDMLSRVGEI